MIISCQSCGAHLAEQDFGTINVQPDILAATQELDESSTLLTLQCPCCDCLLQIKTN